MVGGVFVWGVRGSFSLEDLFSHPDVEVPVDDDGVLDVEGGVVEGFDS